MWIIAGGFLFFLGLWIRSVALSLPVMTVGFMLVMAGLLPISDAQAKNSNAIPPPFPAHDPASPLTVTIVESVTYDNYHSVNFKITNHSNRVVALPDLSSSADASFYCNEMGVGRPTLFSMGPGQMAILALLKPGESTNQLAFVDDFVRFYLPGRYDVKYHYNVSWRYDDGTRIPDGGPPLGLDYARSTDFTEHDEGVVIIDAFGQTPWIWTVGYIVLVLAFLCAIFRKILNARDFANRPDLISG